MVRKMRWPAGLGACALALGIAVAALAGRGHDVPSAAAVAAPSLQSQATHRLVVRTRRAEDLDRAAAFAASLGYTVTGRADGLNALRISAPDGVSNARAVTQLTGGPGILYVEPTYEMLTADVPADPLYSREQAYLSKVHAPEAWDVEKGQSDVLVAVLDTGVDVSHPDLQGRVWHNAAEIPNNNVDDDGNGCIDDVNGCAFVNDPAGSCSGSVNGFVRDDDGHGTFVSGIIAANGNGQGMVGVARGVTILPVKVLDCLGSGDSFGVAQGIFYAARAGAKIMNMSFGGPTDPILVREAVRIAHDQYGVLIVAASGNTGADGVSYPARYPQVLAVGAASSANADKRAAFSTTGPEVDVVAVGEGIVGTVPKATCRTFLPCIGGEPYASGDGTSFSTPQVTGLAALLLSHRKYLSADQMLGIIKSTADPMPAGDRANWAGAGRINMQKALEPQFKLGAPGITRS